MAKYKIKARNLEDTFKLPVEKGGTAVGAETTEADIAKLLETLTSLGFYTVNNITFGTEDLVPGESTLPPGHLHFVIES